MTEAKIQNVLYLSHFNTAKICIPNYTPINWWECDFYHQTKAGYGVEHEIKTSRSDFFADAKKKSSTFNRLSLKHEFTYKHDLLKEGNARSPKHFWYVTPKGLIDLSELPDFAGLKEVEQHGSRLVIKTIRKAPTIHNNKADERIYVHAQSVFYYRFWNIRRAIK